jgi:septal ring factor EnvC (AmiA/AmiB activator)
MIPSIKSSRIHLMLATGICSVLLGGMAWSEDDAQPPEKARALLDQVKKSEQDRQVAVKQTEIDRLKEDQTKTESDSNALKQTIESTSGLMTDTSEHLATLTAENQRLEHELAVTQAWIHAEQLKTAGLKALADAQGKSQSALARRTEEAAARSHLREVELGILQDGKQVPAEGREVAQTDLGKARKALAIAEAKAESEERLAHEAMKAATAKMTLAETKAAFAQRLADNDLTLDPSAAAPKAKSKTVDKSAEKPAPVAAPPKSAASTGTPAKSGANTGTAKSKKAPFTLK